MRYMRWVSLFVNAKADAHITCINHALHFPDVTLITHAKAIKLHREGKRIESVEVERNGKHETYSAPLFVLSCGAVNSAILLLRSKVANSSDLVGRNYMCHTNTAMVQLTFEKNLTHYQKTFGFNDFYHNAPDWEYPLGHVQLLGNVKKEMLKADARFAPNFILESMAQHAVGWWLSSEDLPLIPKILDLSLIKRKIVLQYTPKDLEAHKRLVKRLKKILKDVDQPSLFLSKPIPIGGVAHQEAHAASARILKTSVLDLDCKTHDHDNLYVVDGSFFPSSGAVNPALTIIANALRVSKVLTKK